MIVIIIFSVNDRFLPFLFHSIAAEICLFQIVLQVKM